MSTAARIVSFWCLLLLLLAAPHGVLAQGVKDGEVLVRIETTLGTVDVAVDTKHAPVTAANFLKYVDGKFYDGGRSGNCGT